MARNNIALTLVAGFVSTSVRGPFPFFSLREVDAYPTGVGSCARGFDKFPKGSKHNGEGDLEDNWGDIAWSGLTATLGGVELLRPAGSDQFWYTGDCSAGGPEDDPYLCDLCQGHCNADEDCAGDLECFVRDADEDVPGCSGTDGLWNGTNYCYDPNGGGGVRLLQQREVQEEEEAEAMSGAKFLAGTAYRFKLEATEDEAYFKGFLFRLEGEHGQDLSGSIRTVSVGGGSDVAVRILESSSLGASPGNGMDSMPACDATVAAACHKDARVKYVVEVDIVVPPDQAGKAQLEVTAMVEKHEWYLTSYGLIFEPPEGSDAY